MAVRTMAADCVGSCEEDALQLAGRASPRRLGWANLLARVFAIDVRRRAEIDVIPATEVVALWATANRNRCRITDNAWWARTWLPSGETTASTQDPREGFQSGFFRYQGAAPIRCSIA